MRHQGTPMASLAQTPVQAEPSASHTPWAMLRRDGTVTFAGLGLLGGLYLDGWAHVHLRGLESFFTPWHGVLYTGFLLQPTEATMCAVSASLRRPGVRVMARVRCVAWA